MAEYKSQRLVYRKQLLLILHDEVIDIVVSLRIALRVLEHALTVLRKIPIMQALHWRLGPIKNAIAWLLCKRGQLLFKPLGELSLRRPTGSVVVPIAGNPGR